MLTEPLSRSNADPVADAARQLRSQLALTGSGILEPVEEAMLQHWLTRISEEQ